MLSEYQTRKTHNRYRFGSCNSMGTQLWSRVYDDFDECYEDYVESMKRIRDFGANLALFKWRGVFNLDQAALLVNDKNIYADKLYVEADAD